MPGGNPSLSLDVGTPDVRTPPIDLCEENMVLEHLQNIYLKINWKIFQKISPCLWPRWPDGVETHTALGSFLEPFSVIYFLDIRR
jgi:hypothetical protein